MAADWVASLGRGLLDLVLAPRCLSCRAPVPTADDHRLVCAPCLARLEPVPTPRCVRCSTPTLPHASSCLACPEIPPTVRLVRSAVVMGDEARALVHALKYGGWTSAAGPMADWLAEIPLPMDVIEEVRWAVPVPVSRVRMRERGYNQAERLARNLALRRGLETRPELLFRTRATETQTTLHPGERRANVAGAFAVPERHRSEIEGEHLLLVDDVWTTGATAIACAGALVRSGARVVSVLTFARVLPEIERRRAARTADGS